MNEEIRLKSEDITLSNFPSYTPLGLFSINSSLKSCPNRSRPYFPSKRRLDHQEKKEEIQWINLRNSKFSLLSQEKPQENWEFLNNPIQNNQKIPYPWQFRHPWAFLRQKTRSKQWKTQWKWKKHRKKHRKKQRKKQCKNRWRKPAKNPWKSRVFWGILFFFPW